VVHWTDDTQFVIGDFKKANFDKFFKKACDDVMCDTAMTQTFNFNWTQANGDDFEGLGSVVITGNEENSQHIENALRKAALAALLGSATCKKKNTIVGEIGKRLEPPPPHPVYSEM